VDETAGVANGNRFDLPRYGCLFVSDPETLGVYATKAQEYADVTRKLTNDPQLQAFIDAVKPGGTVLDLGCGPGIAAQKMARAGLMVTAIDPVPEMIELASQHEGVTAKVASFDDLMGANLYDGIWANFSLLHAQRSDIPRHLSNIAKALRPNGVFHIGVKTGTGSSRDSLGRLYTYFTPDELTGLLADAGLIVKEQSKGSDKGLDGTIADWVCLRAWRS
jgi:SAM-dependent methyltransferase